MTGSVTALPTVKHLDITIGISTNNKYANYNIDVDRNRIVGLSVLYNDDFWGEPIIVSMRDYQNVITIITARNVNVTQNRNSKVRIWYI